MSSQLQALLHDGRIDPLLLGVSASEDNVLKRFKVIGKNPDVDTGTEDLVDGGGTYATPTAARVHAIVSGSSSDTGGKQASGTITISNYDQMLAAPASGTFRVIDSDKMVGIQATGSITVVDWQLARNIAATGTITVVSYAQLKAASATATLTVLNYADLADATVTVGATTLTEGAILDWQAATSNALTATSLAAAIDGISGISASADGAVITITVDATGTAGNSTVLTVSDNDLEITAAFAGGRAASTITVAGNALVADTDFNAETDNPTTAENIKVAVHALAEVNATRSGSVVTVTAASKGAAGNSLGLVTSNVAGATVSAATLTGGQTGLTLTLDGTTYVEGTDFTAVTSNAATATAIAAVLTGVSGYDATADGAVVSIVADLVVDGGSDGNVALLTSTTSAATVSAATLTGGQSRTILTVGATGLTAETDFDVDSGDDAITARNIAEAINDGVAGVSAVASGEYVTVTDDDSDETGNTTDLTSSNTSAVLASGTDLAGGEDLATITVNGVALVAGVDFEAETSNTVTAENLAAAINASEDVLIDGIVTASSSGAVVTVTAVDEGTGGNSLTLARDDSDSSSVSGANLTGGRAASTGAKTISVTGIDGDGAEVTETVILNGTNAVNTVNSYTRINDMRVLTVGSGGANAGAITATAATDSTVTSRILTGLNVANTGWYCVPSGFTAYAVSLTGGFIGEATGVGSVTLNARPSGGAFFEQESVTFNAAINPEVIKQLLPPLTFAAGTDIRLKGTTDTDNSVMRGVLDLLVIADS